MPRNAPSIFLKVRGNWREIWILWHWSNVSKCMMWTGKFCMMRGSASCFSTKEETSSNLTQRAWMRIKSSHSRPIGRIFSASREGKSSKSWSLGISTNYKIRSVRQTRGASYWECRPRSTRSWKWSRRSALSRLESWGRATHRSSLSTWITRLRIASRRMCNEGGHFHLSCSPHWLTPC